MKILILILLSIGCILAKRFAIMAPNVFHIGVNEQVSIAVFDTGNPVNVKLYLQDYPHRQKTFSQVQGQVKPGQGHLFLSVKVEPENLPDIASVDKQYVYLVAKSDDAHYQFHKEAKILLSYSDGMVFIQTDKPIYTPKQKVEIRVIPLEFDMKPSRKQITVIVENPQGIRVEQWKNLDSRTGIISKRIYLDENILLGNWTITALYGHRDIHNTSVKFEVAEYVLPKFSVKLSVPPFIMKTDNKFRIHIAARYTFGKPVLGNARVNLDIVGMNGTTFPFARPVIALDTRGNTTLTQKVQTIKELQGKIWFPEKSRLQVQVEVIERATGSKESVVDNSCLFTSSPYVVEFRNTPNYFKPGFPFRAKAVVTHPNKKPAVGVRVLMAANFTRRGRDKSMEVNQKFDRDDPNSMGHTDLNGEVDFAINTQANYHLIIIKVKTDDDRLEEKYNGVANKVVKPFNTNGPFIMIRQNVKKGSVKVNDKMECELFHSEQAGAVSPKKLSFAVVSRGRILSHDTAIALNGGKSKTWQFYVTPQMSPSARLIGYYIDNNGNVVADSILLDVEDSLPTKVEFHKPGKNLIYPGAKVDLRIDTTNGTRLGVVIVDESVYLLRDKNRLTKERIFEAAEDLDLGCGVGGGKDSKDIFKNAGVVLMTDNFVSGARRDYGCSEDESRKKRSVEDDLEEKICCDMARNTENVTCVRLAVDSNKDLSYRCKNAFWKCCIELHGEEDAALLGRSAGFQFDQELEDSISQIQVRKYFPESWFYGEFDVGSNGVFSQTLTLPGTITTWVMQAVAINNQTGLGLATPLRIVSEKNFFVTLKMPYSVKRGEQVSLVATVFNYDENGINQLLQVKLYLKGDKDFCSIASDNKYASIGTINVPPNDAGSVTVPIIPKIVGEVNVEVMAIGTIPGISAPGGMDAVRKRLLVVPEGKEHRKSQSLVLDPSGNLNDEAKSGKDSFQSNEIELKVPDLKKAIPKSLEAMLYVSGNLVGPVVNTTIQGGLERFIRQPTGCGEQNMIYLAPNVYVLEYLMNTKQVTGANEENAYRFIQSGYARELNYRRDDDKSFSAFGNDRPGSTWLTAFVMRVFCKIQEFPGIDIDEKLCDSVNWLVQNQRADGALPEVNMVIHREMVGGVYTEGDVAMTAFVVSTLAECNCKGVHTTEAIQRATNYLEKQYQTLNRPYSMALTSYALSLVNSTKKFAANDRLVRNVVYDSAKKSRHWNAGGNALNVETAGYALLTQIQLGRTSYAGPIVTYLTNQRKGGIGFVSTQDTVVALQALALYSERTAGKSLDLRVKLESEDGKWKPSEIHITPENALLRRQYDVTRFLDGKLFVDTRGTGAGLLEVDLRYNLPASRNESCNFDLKSTVTEIKEKDGVKKNGGQSSDEPRKKKAKGGKKGCKGKKRKKCSEKPVEHEPVQSMNLRVCTRYRKKNYTGMSIMDIGILSGFTPNEDSLRNLKDNLTEVDKVEVSDASMVVYLSEIPNDRELCVDVQFDREYHVGVVQAVPINVYDYYEPDESCTTFYGPDKFSPLKMGVCDVGSKSCKCTQDQCAQHDPVIRSSAKLTSLACMNVYHYAFKGKVLHINEENNDVLYFVKVKKIIKQGNQKLKEKGVVKFYKRASCASPDLEESSLYLFMGKDEKAGRYELDKTSFVKLWRPASNKDRRPASNKDKRVLDEFAKNFNCS